ncbi:MAG: phosphoserine phosphatase SerB [Porticoccaceae bacterium]|nr:phosphoserine phosphatase SerB [Porticoccaceae bacterium]
MQQILLINVSGDDKPGVTSAVTHVLAQYDVIILDIGQAVIHDTLSLGVLARLSSQYEPSQVLEEVAFAIRDLGMQMRVEPVSEASYQTWVSQQGKPRHIVSLLTRVVSAQHIARITEVTSAHGLNIDKIARLSGRTPLDRLDTDGKACVEFSVRGEASDLGVLRTSLLELSTDLDVDIAYQEDTIFRRHRRLVVFDMDSTLIESEVIDELAIQAGVGAEVAAITERAMHGELDFADSFRQRVALLKGLDESVLETVYQDLVLTEGAEHLMQTLATLGYKTAILSGGFTYFAERIRQRLGMDYMFANELDISDGKVTGKVSGNIVDGERKAELLVQLAAQEVISLEQTIAVGDGANDLPMLSLAGLGIAFRAKPLVRANAKQAISHLGLDGILYLMGISDRDVINRDS